MHDERQQINGYLLVLRDVTSRNQDAKVLRQSEEKFSKVFQTSPYAIVITSVVNGLIMDVNDAFVEIMGIERRECVGRSTLELDLWVNPEDRLQVLDEMRRERKITGREIQFRKKTGGLLTGLFSAQRLWVNGELCTLSSIQDITARKLAEDGLLAQEAEYRKLIEHLPGGVLVHRSGRIILANNTSAAFFGAGQAADLIDTDLLERIRPDYRALAELRLNRISGAGQKGTLFEEIFLRRDGSSFDAEVAAMPVMYGGEPAILSLITDITARKQVEELVRNYATNLQKNVEERTAELVRSNQVKDEFLSMMSQELRTPLTGVLGFSDTLLDGLRGPLNEKQEKAVMMIRSSGQHLLEVINDVLDVTKIQADNFNLNTDRVSVQEICKTSLMFINTAAAQKNIGVEYLSPEAGLTLMTDPQRLKQVLINLLNNAVKFSSRGGRIALEVQPDAATRRMRFSVSDNGIGISKEDLPKLFKPFVQLDSKLSRQYEGTGLGLVLVKKLIELQGGSVEVTSQPGVGSCFSFDLPWEPGG